MNRLYLLCYLLTGDAELAEQCFIGGLHTAQNENHVFKDWSESWARRAIVLNGIRMLRPRLIAEDIPVAPSRCAKDERPEILQVLQLPVFERFAFVMSVLEGYSDHECSLHLGCSVSDVVAARTRALERVGRSADAHAKLLTIVGGQNGQKGNLSPRLQELSGLATPA